MNLTLSTTIGLVIAGDDLHVSIVRRGVRGAHSRRGPVLQRFLSASLEDMRRQLAVVEEHARARLVLVVPGAWCAVRPLALNCTAWAGARDEVQKSVPSLFPMGAEDAMLCLIDDAGTGAAPGGWLTATSRKRLEPWLTAIERGFGRGVAEIMPLHVAIASLGIQHEEQVTVVEPLRGEGALAHRYCFAHPIDLAQPMDRAEPSPADWAGGRMLFMGETTGDTVGPHDIGVAAALARTAARRGAGPAYAPFTGRAARRRNRLIAPGAALAAAAALIAGASALMDARYTSAAHRIESERTAMIDQAAKAQKDRVELEGLVRRLNESAARSPSLTPKMMPVLAEAQAAVPREAFLYRVEVDQQGVTIKGEAPRASAVLASLEATERFKDAQSLEPPALVKDRGLETFSIRARREDAAASKGGER